MTPDPSAAGSAARRRQLAGLSVTQLVGWGVLYYALIVAAPVIAEQTGWPFALITALFSAGLVASAVAGMATGRLLDRYGPRLVMTAGSVVGVVGFVLVAVSPDPVTFGIAWVIVGIAQAATLYQAAFTVIARRYGAQRRRAMTILTLVGGLGSTVFAPIVAGLLSVLDWRAAFLVLAGVLAVVTIPLYAFSLERSWAPREDGHHRGADHTVRSVLRSRSFWFLELAMIALIGALGTVIIAAIPLFTEKGMSYELAAVALGVIGTGQVAGRLVFVVLPHATRPWLGLVVVGAASAVLLAALALIPGPAWLLIAVGVVVGAIRGALTLVQGSAVADRWGTRNYGAINGVFAAPLTITMALSPALGPVLAAGLGGYAAMTLALAGVAALAAVLARWS